MWNDDESNTLNDWVDQFDESSNPMQCESPPPGEITVPLLNNEVNSSPRPMPEIVAVTDDFVSNDNRDTQSTDSDTNMVHGK